MEERAKALSDLSLNCVVTGKDEEPRMTLMQNAVGWARKQEEKQSSRSEWQ